jgi:hypothetical protein
MLKERRAEELYRIWREVYSTDLPPVTFGVHLIDVKQDERFLGDFQSRSSRKGLASFLTSPMKDIETLFRR